MIGSEGGEKAINSKFKAFNQKMDQLFAELTSYDEDDTLFEDNYMNKRVGYVRSSSDNNWPGSKRDSSRDFGRSSLDSQRNNSKRGSSIRLAARTNSHSNSNSNSNSLMVIEEEPKCDLNTAVLSMYIMKKNRRGEYQKRLMRFDGTLFVCMSSKKGKVQDTIMDYNFRDSFHSTISQDLEINIREFYPSGSSLRSLGRCLISEGKGTTILPSSSTYYIPKWVIPISKIKEFQIVTSVSSDTFNLVTDTESYSFKAYSTPELNRLKFLIESCKSNSDLDIEIRPDFEQSKAMKNYLIDQYKWKKALFTVISNNDSLRPCVTTLQLNDEGIEAIRGHITAPILSTRANPRRLRNGQVGRILDEEGWSNDVYLTEKDDVYVNHLRTSVDIDRQIKEIDRVLCYI